MSYSSWSHGLQHARPTCPSPTLGAYLNSCPSSQWCHPTFSSSFIPFSSCLQSFPASGSFPISQFFASGGQRIGASASASVLPVNIQGWFSFRIDWFDLLAVQEILKSLLQHHSSKASILQRSASFICDYYRAVNNKKLCFKNFLCNYIICSHALLKCNTYCPLIPQQKLTH